MFYLPRPSHFYDDADVFSSVRADPNGSPNSTAPLQLVGAFKFPSDEGGFDHLTADIPGCRLFTTPRVHKSAEVFDLQTRKLIHPIECRDSPRLAPSPGFGPSLRDRRGTRGVEDL